MLAFVCYLYDCYTYRSLPSSIKECPGGNTSWDSATQTDTALICEDEINFCAKNNGEQFTSISLTYFN